ncbi:MAG: aromatic-ring-hydroxylating dioxygenase subunit beta [Pseudomonadales bacterium]
MSLDYDRRRRLEALYDRYAELLDDGPLEAWPALFTESCTYLVQPRDNFDAGLPLAIMRCESRGMLMDRVRSVQETIMHEPRYLRHQITNIREQQRDTGELDVVASYLVVEVLPDELPRILSVGRYLDRVVEEGDDFLFAEKRVVYDSVLVPNTIVYPL